MRRNLFLHRWALVLLVPAVLVGCSGGPSEEELQRAELASDLEAIEASYEDLQQARQDLEDAQARLEELEGTPSSQLSEEEKAELEELPATVEELQMAQDTAFDDLQNQLAEFLNVALNSFPDAPETEEGLRIYSEEAMVFADDAVAQAGDYKKALDRLEAAKSYYEMAGIEEVYPPLLDKIAEIQEKRYITEERFAEVSKGMTQDEVMEAAGVPYHLNVKKDEERGVEYWLYPKKGGGAAAVYFNKKGKVYSKQFDAVKTKVVD